MPALSHLARSWKTRYFLEAIPKDARILEIGSGSGWTGQYLFDNGWKGYRGIDLNPPADIVGDIRHWRDLGLTENSWDVIIAFEVVEHVDIYPECSALLRPGGQLLVTTPVPRFDWIMKSLETLGLNQKRTSPHLNLHRLEDVEDLVLRKYRVIAGLSQWGVFEKVTNDRSTQ